MQPQLLDVYAKRAERNRVGLPYLIGRNIEH